MPQYLLAMKHVVFVQGAGEGAHIEDARLAESLRRELGPGYAVHFPQMPKEDAPEDSAWTRRLNDELATLDAPPIIVAHSAGGTIVLRGLAAGTLARDIAALAVIAAPFVGGAGWQIDGAELPDDLSQRLPQVPVFLYHGSDDEIVPCAHLALYHQALPRATVRRLPGRDHQLGNDLAAVAEDLRSI